MNSRPSVKTPATPLATQLVGSWSKPQWLADFDLAYGPEGSWWRVQPEHLAEALDDAALLAIEDQNRAGLTYATDGEQRRQSFSGYFYKLGGIDQVHQGEVTDFSNDILEYLTMKQRAVAAGAETPPPPKFEQPRVVGPISWQQPILEDATRFLKSHAANLTKVTAIGPTTLALRLVDEHYGSLDKLAFAVADALNEELTNLARLGVDLIQIDEPEVHFRYSKCRHFATEAIDRAFDGVEARTAVHMCYGYAKNIAEKRTTPVYADALDLLAASDADEISIEYAQPGHTPDLLEHAGEKHVILGVLNLDPDAPVEQPNDIAQRVRGASEVVGYDRLSLAPDCGMWFLPRAQAFEKIFNMRIAADQLRQELPG